MSILSGIDGEEREHCRHSIHIGNYCGLAGELLFILDQDHPITHVLGGSNGGVLPVIDPDRAKGEIILQNDVWFGYGVTVMNGVTVQNGACAAAKSHIVKDVPPYSIVGGNPARVIGQRFTDEQIADLLQIGWWNWSEELLKERYEDFHLPIEAFIEKYIPAVKLEADAEKESYLFFSDFTEPYPVWERVLRQYIAVYGDDPSVRFVLYCPEDQYADANISAIEGVLEEIYAGGGDIVVQVGGDTLDMIRRTKYLLTSRSVHTVQRTEIAYRMGVGVISAFNKPIFHR